MTDIPSGYEIAGLRAHSTPRSPGGRPGRAAPRRGSRTVPDLILKPPSPPLLCAVLLLYTLPNSGRHGLVLQSHWTPCLKEVTEGHAEINFLTICPFPAESLR